MASKYLYISPAMSVQMIVPQTIDSCTILETHDNTLYCDDTPLGYTVPKYYQLYQTCDTVTLQFRSDYSANVVELIDRSGLLIDTFSESSVATSVQEKTTYSGFVKDNGGGETQVFFDQIAFADIGIGSSIEIQDNVNFNGTFTINSVLFDSALNKNYAIITHAFVGADPQDITILSIDSDTVFDVFEAVVDWSTIAVGIYRIRITSSEATFDTKIAFSEWINLKVIHPQTHIVTYKNSSNDWAMDYSTGIVNLVRVQSYFFKRKPTGEQTTFLDNEKLIKVEAKVRRFTDFDITKAAPWFHEKLSLAFAHDFFTINSIEHQTADSYEPEYEGQNSLASGMISLEQVSWIGDYVIPSGGYFYTSPALSITLNTIETVNDCTVLETHDNTLYCEDRPLGYKVPNYHQLYQTCDSVVIQFRSNYSANVLTVRDINDTIVQTPTINQEINGLTGTIDFSGFVDDLSDANTRVYVDQATFPNISVSDSIDLSGNPNFDGTYNVDAKSFDLTRNKEYITIDRAITSLAEQGVLVQVDNTDLDYDVFEGTVDWSLLSDGIYKLKIVSTDGTHGTNTATSEWIDLKEEHPQTHLIKYKNSVDDWDINYSTLIENNIRVQSYFQKRKPGGRQALYLEGETSSKYGGKVRRFTDFEITQAPPYLHEKLLLAFSHDFFSINNVVHQTEELYEPEYIDQYSLASGSISLEQVNWIGNAGSDFDDDVVGLRLLEDGAFRLLEDGAIRELE